MPYRTAADRTARKCSGIECRTGQAELDPGTLIDSAVGSFALELPGNFCAGSLRSSRVGGDHGDRDRVGRWDLDAVLAHAGQMQLDRRAHVRDRVRLGVTQCHAAG